MFSFSRSHRGIQFTRLPGSEAEARNVSQLLGGDCMLRVGKEAREAELKKVSSPRVLHLATHGFFLSDQEFNRSNSLRTDWLRNPGTRWNASLPGEDWENPLIRCGVALAGANHAAKFTNAVADDGLLTGLEAALLNLQGTELVILSACDSGTGEIRIGEGVMSLRRAFRIAGAETVLASHWHVNDKASSQVDDGIHAALARRRTSRQGVAGSAVIAAAGKGILKSVLLGRLHPDRAVALRG